MHLIVATIQFQVIAEYKDIFKILGWIWDQPFNKL